MLEKMENMWVNWKGGLEKIADEKPPCLHREHKPPSMMVYEPGTYRYTCPGCGEVTVFIVRGVYC